ncbi:hypothetical protein ACFO9Q_22725 [Paenibacillus sp. GCM10023252]|uniref:hypothetical protein n=1 Tax=Paenibacillus sp. GCM10023252 TaxID=3252649 RepID=UPI0036105261
MRELRAVQRSRRTPEARLGAERRNTSRPWKRSLYVVTANPRHRVHICTAYGLASVSEVGIYSSEHKDVNKGGTAQD